MGPKRQQQASQHPKSHGNGNAGYKNTGSTAPFRKPAQKAKPGQPTSKLRALRSVKVELSRTGIEENLQDGDARQGNAATGKTLCIMDETAAESRFGIRPIPWQYEAAAWRQWPGLSSISFRGQQYCYTANSAPSPNQQGDCLFRALSCLLTGTAEQHLFIRAQHLKFWQAFDAACKAAADGPGKPDEEVPPNVDFLDKLNCLPPAATGTMQERLGRAHIWQFIEVLEITALLYRVQVVIFDDSARTDAAHAAQEKDKVHRPPEDVELRSFGPLNRTQLFLRFTGPKGGNHFQPLFPDCERPEEFRCHELDDESVRAAARHFQFRRAATRKGPPSEVPLPYLWRPPPQVKLQDIAKLTGSLVVTYSTKPLK